MFDTWLDAMETDNIAAVKRLDLNEPFSVENLTILKPIVPEVFIGGGFLFSTSLYCCHTQASDKTYLMVMDAPLQP